MMTRSRHVVDTRTTYRGISLAELPKSKYIENPLDEPRPGNELRTILVDSEPYLPDAGLIEAVNLAIALGRPLLLQGDPGCGKTRLAYAVAYELGLPLEECYIKSTTRAQDLLYTYDAVNRLYDAELGVHGTADENGEPRIRNVDNYISFDPLGRAIVRAQAGRRSVVLIDEIDKADLDFPNDLLLELDRLEFRVVEQKNRIHAVPRVRPDLRPIVIVTNNEEKALPVAFLRRCIFHYLEFPADRSLLNMILAVHNVHVNELGDRAIECLLKLRTLNLNKPPGLSELLDWVGYLEAVNASEADVDSLRGVGALIKNRNDQLSVSKHWSLLKA